MARRTFAEDSPPKSEKAARQLPDLLAERKEPRFSVRDIQRLRRKGLESKPDLDPALRKLEEAELIRPASHSPGPNGGAPPRLYLVNPVVFAKG